MNVENGMTEKSLSMKIAETFVIKDDCLEIGGIPLTRLETQIGQTPFFAYSRKHIDLRVCLLRKYLPEKISIHYAIKANPFVPLIHHLSQKIEGFDVASANEMALALNTGISPEDISFAGPGKTDAELKRAISAQVLLNVESLNELRRIQILSEKLGLCARVSLRINPDYNLNSSGMKMGGGPRQFGMDVVYVPDALMFIRDCPDSLVFEGFQLYPGSQNLRAEHLIEAQNKALDLVIELSRFAPSPVRRFNLGGGFGVPYFQGDTELNITEVGNAMHKLVERAEKLLPEAEIILELGRYLVASSGIYVTKIVERKTSHGMVFLVTDGGMNHHLSASGNLGQLIRRNYPSIIGNKIKGERREIVNIVGPLCTPLDILVHQGDMSVATPGDLVVIFQSGAYGLSASPNNFLSQKNAVEVLV
ncbi:pyridoxal-dependent decarboxylase, exosortase A system-associated [Photorhabdus sp. CRCIA-P01]|uniref:pyridoxal-dependent decarboxylase, exosortase A system-associated n=1 Tax=Photorhabdus sp. CRCIA-P01 TaxID=2019570 RepID=UPI000E5999C6|nr:pyridoxal-dependent decarboxylase, exosortase A system-associated [Photorhabdus sp. CRCIA-P01]